MKILRITNPRDVCLLWEFFNEGFESIAKHGDVYDSEMMRKTLCAYCELQERAVIVVGFRDCIPVSFAIWEDGTPMFAPFRSFICRSAYTRYGDKEMTVALLRYVEQWAKVHEVKKLIIGSRRHCGASIKKYTSTPFNFNKTAILFEKEV
jgi:hypothetical protein